MTTAVRQLRPPRLTLAEQLGARLVDAREAAGESRRQTAARLGVAPNTLRELELGLANPTLRRVEDLADALGLDLELTVRRRRRRA